jgi:GT2 family glycosyltransferase
MRASSRDVVLLNSDTIVTARWLDKLIDASVSSGDIGTVTPLSNNATLCYVPRAFEENLIPTGFDVESFADLVERVSARSYPRLPTGVGVCLFIRRALLDDIGFFDAERYGLGYGEETISACGRWRAAGCPSRTTPHSSRMQVTVASARRAARCNARRRKHWRVSILTTCLRSQRS